LNQAEFPAPFAWGTVSGATQSEGASVSSDWIIRERKELAPRSENGNDKRRRYDDDFLRLSELGLTHHRMGIDWSRIEPQRGVYDRNALEEYRRIMEAARRRGISLWVTLHQVTVPYWFSRMGGFLDSAALAYWHRYAELIAKELGREADFWIPVHEPVTYAAGAFLLGLYPPAQRRMDKFSDMLIKIHQVHGDAYQILKSYLPSQAKVGMAALIAPVEPADPESDQDRISADFIDSYINQPAVDCLQEGLICIPGKAAVELPSGKGAADFFGIDYFFRLVVGERVFKAGHDIAAALQEIEGMPGVSACREDDPLSAHGYGACPTGVYEAIKKVHNAGISLPIYITASGLATDDEDLRSRYVKECISQVRGAVEQGLDVRGYFHYSDVDGYEWNRGFDAHYGLFGVDRESMDRIKRPAADALAEVALPSHAKRDFDQGPGRRNPA